VLRALAAGRRRLGVANRQARLHCSLLLLAARSFIFTFAQASSILHLEIVSAFLARRIAQCTARSSKKTHRAEPSYEHFHFADSLSFVTE
jgi:hypothetical protein